MAKNKIELKPCPFCGQVPLLDAGHGFFRVMCNNYECWILPKTDIYGKMETACEAWNERAATKQESDCDSCATKSCKARSASVARINCPLWRPR